MREEVAANRFDCKIYVFPLLYHFCLGVLFFLMW